MHTVQQDIKNLKFNKLQVQKIQKTDTNEILCFSLEKDGIFPEHTSPTDAWLLVLEGEIEFNIANNPYHLSAQEHMAFKKNEAHWIKAISNSKFLIVR